MTVRLTDANSVAGSLYAEADQQINVSDVVVGNIFTASPDGVFSQSCHASGNLNTGCGTVTYYNQDNTSPTLNDTILTGPNGIIDAVTNPGGSPYAPDGFYSYDCGDTGLGNRNYFRIFGGIGEISQVATC